MSNSHPKTYHNLFMHNRSVVLIMEAESGRILEANPAACAFYGYSKDVLLRMSYSDLSAYSSEVAMKELNNSIKADECRIATKHYLADKRVLDVGIFVGPLDPDSPKQLYAMIHDITPFKDIHDRLLQTTNELTALIQASPLPMVALDIEKHIIRWNPAAEGIFGWTGEEVIGQNAPHIPVERQDEYNHIINRVFQGESFAGYETVRQRRDGSYFPANISWAPMRNEFDRIWGAMGVIKDISARKKGENELKKSEERLELALEASGAALWDWDVATGIGYISSKCYSILGYEMNEVLPTFESWRNLVHPDERSQLVENVKMHMASGDSFFNGIYRAKHKNDQWRWVHLYGRLIINEHGEYVRITGMFIDVTQQVLAEKALNESQQRFQEIFTLSPIGIQVYDADGILRETNEAAMKIFGSEREQVIGDYNCFSDPNVPIERKRQLGQTGSMAIDCEYDFQKIKESGIYLTSKSGVVHLKLVITPLGERENLFPKGYMVQIQDVTAEKNAIKETLQQSARTEALLRTASGMNSSLELHEVLYSISLESVMALEANMSSVSLLDTESDEFYHVTGYGLPGFFIEQNIRVPRRTYEKYFNSGEPVFIIPDVQRITGPLSRLFNAMNVRTIVSVPIVHNMAWVGSLSIFYTDVKAIGLEEKILLQGLSDQAGMAVVNALLFSEVQSGREQLKEINNRVITMQEEERRQISRELHDEAGQALTALKIHLELIEGDLPEKSEVSSRLKEAVELTGQTLEQIRSLAQTLRPPALDALGINLTLEDYCREYARRIRIPIEYIGVELPVLPDAVNITLYRFLQEALTNVAKHAKAKHIFVRMGCSPIEIVLKVCDDGDGFLLSEIHKGRGMGLVGMSERLETLGGRLHIQSEPKSGTCLTACIPLGG